MTVCFTPGCDNEAIFAATCSFCSIGKRPSLEEAARSSRPKALATVNVAPSTATFIGSLNPTVQQKNAAEKFAGNDSTHDKTTTNVGSLKLHHITTPGSPDFSIWFIRNVSGHHIDVYGIGHHDGSNKKYKVTCHDGKVRKVDLNQN